jgi:hypothetical protein
VAAAPFAAVQRAPPAATATQLGFPPPPSRSGGPPRRAAATGCERRRRAGICSLQPINGRGYSMMISKGVCGRNVDLVGSKRPKLERYESSRVYNLENQILHYKFTKGTNLRCAILLELSRICHHIQKVKKKRQKIQQKILDQSESATLRNLLYSSKHQIILPTFIDSFILHLSFTWPFIIKSFI